MTYERGEGVYRCPARNRSTVCLSQVSVRAEYVEDHLWQVFQKMVAAMLALRGSGEGEPLDAKHRAIAADAASHRERATALRSKLDSLTLVSEKLGSEYARQASLLVEEIDAADAEADALEAQVSRRRANVSADALRPVGSLPLDERQTSLRALIEQVYVKPSPRKGRGQRDLIPERVVIVWRDDVDDDVRARAALLDGDNVHVGLSMAPGALGRVTKRSRARQRI